MLVVRSAIASRRDEKKFWRMGGLGAKLVARYLFSWQMPKEMLRKNGEIRCGGGRSMVAPALGAWACLCNEDSCDCLVQ